MKNLGVMHTTVGTAACYVGSNNHLSVQLNHLEADSGECPPKPPPSHSACTSSCRMLPSHMSCDAEYEEVYTWLGDWPEGCTISHLANHFDGYRPKKHLTKWLKQSQALTVFPYDGIEDAAVRRNLDAPEQKPRSSSTKEKWHEHFLSNYSLHIPAYDALTSTSTTKLEAVRAAILTRTDELTEMRRRIEEELEERGWEASESSTMTPTSAIGSYHQYRNADKRKK